MPVRLLSLVGGRMRAGQRLGDGLVLALARQRPRGPRRCLVTRAPSHLLPHTDVGRAPSRASSHTRSLARPHATGGWPLAVSPAAAADRAGPPAGEPRGARSPGRRAGGHAPRPREAARPPQGHPVAPAARLPGPAATAARPTGTSAHRRRRRLPGRPAAAGRLSRHPPPQGPHRPHRSARRAAPERLCRRLAPAGAGAGRRHGLRGGAGAGAAGGSRCLWSGRSGAGHDHPGSSGR